MPENRGAVPVAIVGAGPTGLAAAIALARQGIASVVLERRPELSRHPKARGVRLRTMEILRSWHLESDLLTEALPADAQRFIYCDSVAGQELARTADVSDAEADVSPSRSIRVAQSTLEAHLMRRAQRDPLIEVRMGETVVALEQGPSHVTLSLQDQAGQSTTLRAGYVLAADGAGSTVRRLIGVTTLGAENLGYWQSIHWRGDISGHVAGRHCIQFHTGARRGKPLSVAPVDGKDHWITMVPMPPGSERPAPLARGEATEAVKTAVGDNNLEPDVLDLSVWRISATIADGWQRDRVLLLGDAAHTFPPTGGFGMNCGIHDAHNLAWKLALVLKDQASPELLATYEQERRPVATEYAAWSVKNGQRNRDINDAIRSGDDERLHTLLAAQRDHILALSQDLGFTYSSSTDTDEPAATGEPDGHVFAAAVRLGQRAPHAWLTSAGSRLSTLDLLGEAFVLLVADGRTEWSVGTQGLGGRLPPVAVYAVARGLDVEPADAEFERLYELEARGPLLIRPDGHVAWRFSRDEHDLREELGAALGLLTGRSSSPRT